MSGYRARPTVRVVGRRFRGSLLAAVVICLLALFVSPGSLRNWTTIRAQGAWSGYGLGVQGCGKYLDQRRVPNRSYDDLVGSWFYGFISAYNYYGPRPQVGKEVDQETVLAYLDKYCRDAPLASVGAGALQLVKTFAK